MESPQKPSTEIGTSTPDKLSEELTCRLHKVDNGSNLRRSARRKIDTWIDEPKGGRQTCKAGSDSVDVEEEMSVKLPHEYEILGEFFSNMDKSIRSLKSQQTMCSFSNLSHRIELLSKRVFTLQNLAQLKYILPEAIEIKKVLELDEQTNCTKPELHVAIDFDSVKLKANVLSKVLLLRKLFWQRLVDFYNSHPEGTEIPEEMLPEPFNRAQRNLSSKEIKEPISTPAETSFDVTLDQSRSAFAAENAKVESTDQTVDLTQSDRFSPDPTNEQARGSKSLTASKGTDSTITSQACTSSAIVLLSSLPATGRKGTDSMNNLSNSTAKSSPFCSTPVKLASTPARLMSSTPEVRPPKRSYLSPEIDSMSSPSELVMQSKKPRALKFETYPVKNQKEGDEDDNSNILLKRLLQSFLVGNYMEDELERAGIMELGGTEGLEHGSNHM